MRSNVALAMLSIVGTFAMMAGSRRRSSAGGKKTEQDPIPTGIDTTVCRTWVTPADANVPPAVVRRANELQQLANAHSSPAGTEWVEQVGDELWKFRRELHGPNAQNPNWHLGVGVKRCVRSPENSTETGGEPDANGCLWIWPRAVPPEISRRVAELEALRPPLWTQWIEELNGETWKFRCELQAPNEQTPRWHHGISTLRCERPSKGTASKQPSAEADVLLEAALDGLRELGTAASTGAPGVEVPAGPGPSCSCERKSA